jgi:hypothetical protein
MAFKRVLGKFLLLFGGFLAGIVKLVDPVHSEKLLISGYSKFFAKSKEFGIGLPLAPVMVANYSSELITLTGVLLILGNLLVLFNSKLGVYLLTLLYLSFCIVIHTPILQTDPGEYNLNFYNFLLNLVIVAGLWMTCGTAETPAKGQTPAPEAYKGKTAWQRKKKE